MENVVTYNYGDGTALRRQHSLANIKEYFDKWKIHVNAGKRQLINFGYKSTIPLTQISISNYIYNHEIRRYQLV